MEIHCLPKLAGDRISAFVLDRLAEIGTDSVLRYYGALLALVNLPTWVFWHSTQSLAKIVTSPAICWPFLTGCTQWRSVDATWIEALLLLMIVASLIAAHQFIFARTVTFACIGLVICTAIKATVVLMDYRLTLNQHYMAVWTVAVFILAPGTRLAVAALLMSFYFWAGVLKLDFAWLSGAALYGFRPLGIPSNWVPAACLYVAVLELGLVFGLLSRRHWLWWLTLAQLLLFHLSSYWVVGFYYPVLMFMLLALLPLSRVIPSPGDGSVPSERAGGSVRVTRSVTCVVIVFGVFQMIPKMIPGDAAVTGEGRIFALNMFDAPMQCRAGITVQSSAMASTTERLLVPFLQPRIVCDPLVYLEAARRRCEMAPLSGFGDLDLWVQSRRSTSDEWRQLVDLKSVCSSFPSYRLFGHNSWIVLWDKR